MKKFYARVTSQGIAQEEWKTPTLKEMQRLVGKINEPALIEVVYGRFSESRLVIICDEEGMIKELPLVAVSAIGDSLFGDLLIYRLRENLEDEDNEPLFGWLNKEDLDLIRKELHLESSFV